MTDYVYYRDGSGVYVLSDGVYTPFLPPGADWGGVRAINDNGYVLGFGNDGMYYLLSNGEYTAIDFGAGLFPAPVGINNTGEILGRDTEVNDGFFVQTSFVYSGGVYTRIAVPGSPMTLASGINNFGAIVGDYPDADNKSHGFMYRDGVFTTIAGPEGGFISITGINDRGDIVGAYFGADMTPRAFVGYAVVPEPSSLVLAALGPLASWPSAAGSPAGRDATGAMALLPASTPSADRRARALRTAGRRPGADPGERAMERMRPVGTSPRIEHDRRGERSGGHSSERCGRHVIDRVRPFPRPSGRGMGRRRSRPAGRRNEKPAFRPTRT